MMVDVGRGVAPLIKVFDRNNPSVSYSSRIPSVLSTTADMPNMSEDGAPLELRSIVSRGSRLTLLETYGDDFNISDEDILEAARRVLSRSLGDMPTLKVNDVYTEIAQGCRSVVWRLREKPFLSAKRIGRVLVKNGFENITTPHSPPRYRPPLEFVTIREGVICPTCSHYHICSCDEASTENGICGNYQAMEEE